MQVPVALESSFPSSLSTNFDSTNSGGGGGNVVNIGFCDSTTNNNAAAAARTDKSISFLQGYLQDQQQQHQRMLMVDGKTSMHHHSVASQNAVAAAAVGGSALPSPLTFSSSLSDLDALDPAAPSATPSTPTPGLKSDYGAPDTVQSSSSNHAASTPAQYSPLVSHSGGFHQSPPTEQQQLQHQIQSHQQQQQTPAPLLGAIGSTPSATSMAAAASIHNQSVFINKLYTMLEEANTDLISWDQTGSFFIVHDTTAFSKSILPLYFKHSNFASFVRQLNMYGFHKVNDSNLKMSTNSEQWEFKNPNFRRGEIHLLQNIKRKAPSKSSKGQAARAHSDSAFSIDGGDLGGAGSAAAAMPSSTRSTVASPGGGNSATGGASSNGMDPARDERVEALSRKIVQLEEKLAKLHESYNILWSETVSCRLLQSKHHQIITNMTTFLASIYREDSDRKRKFDMDVIQK
ncbi:HSF-type DNA-binding-domain-containing protein [Zopfochytrium polystomum]|nr:HSF-type DNA-binding-domain-containing protein [Zopfochytrium polystomum]